jgi:hypothetical protein
MKAQTARLKTSILSSADIISQNNCLIEIMSDIDREFEVPDI